MSRNSIDRTGDAAAATGRDPADSGARHAVAARPSSNALRRLGPLEYLLLGLIALGIAITIAMAFLNP